MKLGVTYSAFEGMELLEKSILSVRDNVDFVQVMWQEYGWRQDKILPEDLETLHRLKENKLIDNLASYNVREFPSFGNKVLQTYERHKRLIGMNQIQQIGKCTHMFFMDSDEFYRPEELKAAKEFISANSIERTFVSYHTLMNKPTFRILDLPVRWTSFITRCDIIVDDRRYGISNVPIDIDPTRVYHFNSANDYIFPPNRIAMYHMQGVRKDLYKKFYSNTGCQARFLKEIIDNIRNIKEPNPMYQGQFLFGNGVEPISFPVETIPNHFGIPDLITHDSIPLVLVEAICPDCSGKSYMNNGPGTTCERCKGTRRVHVQIYQAPRW